MTQSLKPGDVFAIDENFFFSSFSEPLRLLTAEILPAKPVAGQIKDMNLHGDGPYYGEMRERLMKAPPILSAWVSLDNEEKQGALIELRPYLKEKGWELKTGDLCLVTGAHDEQELVRVAAANYKLGIPSRYEHQTVGKRLIAIKLDEGAVYNPGNVQLSLLQAKDSRPLRRVGTMRKTYVNFTPVG